MSAKRDVGRVICVTTTTALGGTLHGSKSIAVQCDPARRGMLSVKFSWNSRIGLMSQVAASLLAGGTHETAQDGLRHDHSALAAGRRVRRCIRQRNAYRDRSARTQLDQFVRCGSPPECVGDAYAGGR